MPYLYILKNEAGKHYTGITKLHPNQRLKRHNKGDVHSTKKGFPWEIVYMEEHMDIASARSREKQIKSWHGGITLRRFLDKAAGSSNGRTQVSETCYLGSNPSPAVLIGNQEKN